MIIIQVFLHKTCVHRPNIVYYSACVKDDVSGKRSLLNPTISTRLPDLFHIIIKNEYIGTCAHCLGIWTWLVRGRDLLATIFILFFLLFCKKKLTLGDKKKGVLKVMRFLGWRSTQHDMYGYSFLQLLHFFLSLSVSYLLSCYEGKSVSHFFSLWNPAKWNGCWWWWVPSLIVLQRNVSSGSTRSELSQSKCG